MLSSSMLIRTFATVSLALTLATVGCSDLAGGSSAAPAGSAKTANPAPNPAAAPTAQSPQGALAAAPNTPVERASASTTPPAQSPWEVSAQDDAARREQAENMIYATIRIRMEEMIAQRAKLLNEGRDPADVEVRRLEGSIMKARDLLMENGEVVEDVEPPIVVASPR